MFLSCQVHISHWINTLQLPECQGTPCSNRCDIWSLSECNRTRTHNHLLRKRTLKPFSHLSKWLSVRLRTKWHTGNVRNILQDCFFFIEDLAISLMKFTAFVSRRPTLIFEMIKTNMADGGVHQMRLWKKMITENLGCMTNALKLPELIS